MITVTIYLFCVLTTLSKLPNWLLASLQCITNNEPGDADKCFVQQKCHALPFLPAQQNDYIIWQLRAVYSLIGKYYRHREQVNMVRMTIFSTFQISSRK